MAPTPKLPLTPTRLAAFLVATAWLQTTAADPAPFKYAAGALESGGWGWTLQVRNPGADPSAQACRQAPVC